jgi:outer membrane protein insertion porin family
MLSYTEPWLLGYPLSAGFDIYDWLRAYQDFTKDAYGVRLRAGYPVGQWSHLNFFYVWENASITDIDPALAALPEYRNLSGMKSSPGVSFERDTTDHPFLPTKGSYAGVIAEWSAPQLGSDSDFVKYEFHAGMYHPLGIWKFIGHLRGETGYLIGDQDKIPIYERFFLGGINSLRGFDFGQVGPRQYVLVTNANGVQRLESVIIGGTSYVVANAEILFPIMEKMGVRGVFFFDAGNAYQDIAKEFSIDGLRTDAGGGLRWNSPFGPLRVEMGYNLDRKHGEDAYHWQFSAGAFF